jgi:hypothetical protein
MNKLMEHKGLLDALRGAMTPKFLATRSAAGVPNVIPLTSIMPGDDGTQKLFFGNFLLRKSIANLNEDSRCSVLVVTEALDLWEIRCEFLEFQKTGTYVERQNSAPLLRYNAYTGIRNAGVMKVVSVVDARKISKASLLAGFATAKAASLASKGAGGTLLPLAARREWARLQAVKVLAWIGDDGHPRVQPVLSLQPAGEGALVCRVEAAVKNGPRDGNTVAANVLTMDAVSYQVKGRWHPGMLTGLLDITEVYAGGPPLPGGRVA